MEEAQSTDLGLISPAQSVPLCAFVALCSLVEKIYTDYDSDPKPLLPTQQLRVD